MSHGNDLSKHNRRKDAPTKHTYHRAPPFEVIRHLPTFLGLLCGVYGRPLFIHAGVRLLQIELQRCEGSAVYQGRLARQDNPRDAKLIGSVIGASPHDAHTHDQPVRRACIFCGRDDRKISGEHVWPKWIRALFSGTLRLWGSTSRASLT